MNELRTRVLNVLIALDQFLFCVVTLGVSSPDETASSAAYRTEQKGRILGRFFRPLIDWIFSPIERDHCRRAYEAEISGQHRPQP